MRREAKKGKRGRLTRTKKSTLRIKKNVRQTGKAGRQAGRQTGRQAGRQTGRQADRQADSQTGKVCLFAYK